MTARVVVELVCLVAFLWFIGWGVRRRVTQLETDHGDVVSQRDLLALQLQRAREEAYTLAMHVDQEVFSDRALGNEACLRPGLMTLLTYHPTLHFLPRTFEPRAIPKLHRQPGAPAGHECDHTGPLWVREMVCHGRMHWVALCRRCAQRWQQTGVYVPPEIVARVQAELSRQYVNEVLNARVWGSVDTTGQRLREMLQPLCRARYADPKAAKYDGAVWVNCDHEPEHGGKHRYADDTTALDGPLVYEWSDDDPGAGYALDPDRVMEVSAA